MKNLCKLLRQILRNKLLHGKFFSKFLQFQSLPGKFIKIPDKIQFFTYAYAKNVLPYDPCTELEFLKSLWGLGTE
jgi:hypothetical protein